MNGVYQNTIRYSVYTAAIMVILTLTGMFTAFQSLPIVTDMLNLGNMAFIVSIFGTGYLITSQLANNALTARLPHAVVSALIISIPLAVVVIIQNNVDMTFVFRNLEDLAGSALLFQQESIEAGIVLMIIAGIIIAILSVITALIPEQLRLRLFIVIAIITIIGLLQNRLNAIIVLPDAITVIMVFLVAYVAVTVIQLPGLMARVAVGAVIGTGFGIALLAIVAGAGLDNGSWLRGSSAVPRILQLAEVRDTETEITDEETEEVTIETGTNDDRVAFVIIIAIVGAIGALVANSERRTHNAAWYLLTGLLLFALLNWQDENSLLLTIIEFVVLLGMFYGLPIISKQAQTRFEALGANHTRPPQQQQTSQQSLARWLSYGATLCVLLVVPIFAGQYITSVLDLVMLYIIMGIGLNVMIGYAGLLDLGYVASYAIGAYTAGILSTPSVITVGCVSPDAINSDFYEMCTGILTTWEGTGILTFWQTVPLAVLFSAFTGMMLGVPVLRLRGDYLAIVTLGFGEIVNRLLLSNTFKPLVGGAQGISPIPSPVIDLTGLNINLQYTFGDAQDNYYLFLAGVAIAAFVVLRLANSRLGRAWRAIRADEDVAEAIGIHLVWTKLMAFGISSAFAGLGGAIFGGWLQGIFPNSFTLFVSINVLSLIIIGGMGSITGVILGAFLVFGLPEALREIQDYRLLAFGSLLVIAMLLKPDGILPPQPPKLSERATKTPNKETPQEVT